MERAYQYLFTGSVIFLAVLIFLCLIRAIKGPRISDRIVSINMIGTMTMSIISILAVFMKEEYLLDVSIIYAMISFLSVVVITKVYMGVYNERKQKELQDKKQLESAEKLEQQLESSFSKLEEK